ncbi:hypothetical protein GCM10011386_26730 [Parapedobacter defluvii]|uniref:Uncharacterized protein n=1 Tax=Parapedobacter defluvii TaxID=2045106 RepID=A0ABQ1M1K1_9SPHI|nr:hypothetical protein [Parapedobacter defluvii]GGC33290.1 hypothetical protein GCM10011386_26730 [Parapedobacter defluvii]
MLLIQKGQPTKLPEEYHSVNNICAYIYDHLTLIVANPDYYPYLRLSSFHFPDENGGLDLPLENEHILDWLAKNEKKKELQHFLIKHISLSVLTDLVNFIHESLLAAQKGKITVAYSLLRKPFTDELFLLEQLLAEPESFVESFFYNGDPKSYDPSKRNTSEYKRKIIAECVRKCPNFGMSSSLIYDFRYEKSCEYGINGISNKALHIVTTDQHYKTQNQNFNFIFSTADDYKRYFKHYYFIVPILLIYTANVVDEVISQFLPDEINDKGKIIRGMQRIVAYESLRETGGGMFAWLSKQLTFECDTCKVERELTVDPEKFLESGAFCCPQCGAQAIFSDEEIEIFKLFLDNLRNIDMDNSNQQVKDQAT